MSLTVAVLYRARKQAVPEHGISASVFSRAFTVAVILSFLVGVALFGTLTFLPLYAQGVLGYSAQDSGLVLAPMMIGFVIGSLIGGQLTTRTGRYKVQT